MFRGVLNFAPIVVASIAAAAWALGWNTAAAYAQCGCCQHGSHAGHGAGSDGHRHGTTSSEQDGEGPAVGPHGGHVTKAPPLNFEIVFLPQEIRVYLFGRMPHPESVKDVTGEVSLQRPYSEPTAQLPLRYAAQAAGQQDYLWTPADLGAVKDGELTATIQLANLPSRNRPTLTFTQRLVVSRARSPVAVAALDAVDLAGIDRQRVCPVTGAALGSMGNPIKVLVGEQKLYLCCKGCLAKVAGDPETYLRKASRQDQIR